jgi:predicted pyridoxine 5'-phosphate oxidase superfamily flavin-nucleotide-binding protein
MALRFLQELFSPDVLAAQEEAYGRSQKLPDDRHPDALGPEEFEFIAARDSFYMASVSPDGWPYIQHRGGVPGFLQSAGGNVIVFPDYRGNRQLISTGHVKAGSRVALFLMDYPHRARLKLLGHASVFTASERPDLAARFASQPEDKNIERFFVINVIAFDWNCPKYITPRYTAEEVAKAVAPLKQRIVELETQLGSVSTL